MKGNGQNIHELTSIEAYLLSEKAGHPSHMHDYFWSQAETIVRQRLTVVKVAVKAAKTTARKSSRAQPPASLKVAIAKRKPAATVTKRAPESKLLLGEKLVAAKPRTAAAKPKAVVAAKKKPAPKAK